MKKILIASISLFLIASCSGPKAGMIPKGREKNPDISSKYIEMGAMYNSKAKTKADYPEFANQKCRDFGKKSYEAYKFSHAGGMVLGAYPIGLPITDVSRTAQIWCK